MRHLHLRAVILLLVSLALIGWGVPTAANFLVEYNWWKELGQVSTWVSMMWYSVVPAAAGALVAFIALYLAHTRGLQFAGIRQRDFPVYSGFVPVGLALFAIMFASSAIDSWTVMRFVGSRGLRAPVNAWQDQVFSHKLPFYLFDLPFYSDLLGFLFALAILSAMLFWLTARGWQLVERVRYGRLLDGPAKPLGLGDYLRLPGAARAPFIRIIAVILLLGFAVWIYLGNYELLFNTHAFMTGADYVDEKITLPLRWLLIICALAALPLVWRSILSVPQCFVLSAFILQLALPAIIRSVYVRPNEISIERPYIERHIEATTAAFGLDRNALERPFTPSSAHSQSRSRCHSTGKHSPLGPSRLRRNYHADSGVAPLLHFPDTDVDRYFINGRIKQVLLSPREIDVSQLSAEAERELDQSALHLHPRLWRGGLRGQQDYA